MLPKSLSKSDTALASPLPAPSSRQAANQEVSAAATTFLRPPMQTQIPADCETGPVKEPPARLRAPVCLGGEAFGNGRHKLAMRV